MKRIVTCAVAVALLYGCAAPRLPAATADGPRKEWVRCLVDKSYLCAQKYDDPDMCTDQAATACAGERLVYIDAFSQTVSSPAFALKSTEDMERKLRVDLLAKTKQFIIDAQRRADAPYPVPMEIR